jgi:hypothetical protein
MWRSPALGRAGRTLAVAGLALLATAAVLAAFLALGALIDEPFGEFSRDAAAVLHGPFYVSYLSHLDSLVWNLAAVVALFAAAVLRRAGYVESFRLLLAGGLITATMALDDLLLLHESAQRVLGLPEAVVYCVYGLLILAFVVAFRRRLGPDVLLIGGALVFWVASAGIDLVVDQGNVSFVAEDGLKIAGVALWVTMLVRLAWAEMTAALPARGGPSDGSTAEHRPGRGPSSAVRASAAERGRVVAEAGWPGWRPGGHQTE